MTRLPLTLVVITQDAATQLPTCLTSVPFADEILVVDSGSRDATATLAEAHGARVVHQTWLGFGPQKRFAVEQANHDWVLCLDADESLSPALAASIQQELAAPRFHAYRFARRNRFMGRWLRHGEGYPDWQVRLFHRDHAQWRTDPIHEGVETPAPVGTLAGDLLHESAQTLENYLTKQNRYTSLQAERLIADGKRPGPARIVLSPLLRFLKFYLLRLGFLDGTPGLVHILIGCFNSFSKYAKAREGTGNHPPSRIGLPS
ncbi:MAG: glycosyltransferase family 2 protein [Magnetococcales bacterium]|nr:glycosyltransferase family 2 protein [Magnetococcales bacterium]